MSVNNPEKVTQQREERRSQILHASIGIFAKKGLAAAKISDIAEAAGISHGHVYNYYSSKEELFVSLVKMLQERYGRVCEEARRREGNARDKLLWHARKIGEDENALNGMHVVLHAETIASISPEEKREIPRRAVENLQPIIAIVKQGQEEGTFREGRPEDLAVLYFALLNGVSGARRRGLGAVANPDEEQLVGLLCK
ncbi:MULTISPECIES: TetR/AcrR family transcriptional regulator [unclassified Paenibacillus]|uniref:TetR/AcrR family transcriptional regulator n=1 Tax=unclassified Paenibacillus TaxID=185978 RepID=UPI00020D744B|nr:MULTISPECIES: TetR/AcrR family transcriptional regulator [unclassified Paenibacillus]EGL16312.1 transcriptional regulator, TetR family [Paenibacillus sp. HGF7]EPD82238.1 hypothetical protein HMPREF1207_04064 [Paenibacillus sp. HGH0039]